MNIQIDENYIKRIKTLGNASFNFKLTKDLSHRKDNHKEKEKNNFQELLEEERKKYL